MSASFHDDKKEPTLFNCPKMSGREHQVAEIVAKGVSNKEAADLLFVTEKTIKFHLTSIYKKLGINTRSQLIVMAIRMRPPKPVPIIEPVVVTEAPKPEPVVLALPHRK